MGRGETRGGEKGECQVLEAAGVESYHAMYEEGASPMATEKIFGFGSRGDEC